MVCDEGQVTGLELVRMQPGPLDASGRRHPQPVAGSEFEVEVDNVILAVGERADLGFLADSGVDYEHEVGVSFVGSTSRAGVFACGDVAFGHGTVTQAISTGRRAAEAVEAHANGRKKSRSQA